VSESLEDQVKRLADFIMFEVPGEPSQSEGAIDCAIRIIREGQAKAARLVNYWPDGRCRWCSYHEHRHQMRCKLYVGALTHKWLHTRINPTFGGIDHDCSCGGWFRQGGLAGHGDGTSAAEPICPRAEENWRGPRPEDAVQ
jgi:hypothetical protein